MATNGSSSSVELSSNESSSNSIAVLVHTSNQDIEMIQIVNKWVDVFKENPRVGTIKLLAVLVDCLDIEICVGDVKNFNSDEMYMKITNCLKTLEASGRLHSVETIKKLPNVNKTLKFLNSIFSQHSSLFLSSTESKNYFMFVRNIFVKMSQSKFPGPRLLATYFGLKIITGLMQYESTVMINGLVIELLEEFMFKRWKDTSYIIREAVLSELEIWLQISPSFFTNRFWKHIYYALCDKSCLVQNIALKICKYLFTYHYNDLDVKRLIQKLLSVLTNLLVSKNEEVAISALKAYSMLDSDDIDEEYSSTIESIALELIFSENSNIACYAARHFFDHFVNTGTNSKDRLKFLVTFLSGVPQHLSVIATTFFADAIYEICPDLKDYKLVAEVLTTENFLDQNEKCILATLLMYIVKREITGIGPESKTANIGFVKDISENHINKVEKREFTACMLPCLLNEMRNCEIHTYAFSLLVLMQFIDYKLDKMAIPIILKQLSIFYNTYNVPTLLEMISRNIYAISSCLKSLKHNFCLEHIKYLARVNVEVLKSGTIHHQENFALPSLSCQKSALIRIWSLAKYNQIPEELNTLFYLSYYIPNLNDSRNNLVVSKFAFYAYFEILKNKLITESDIKDEAAKFIECMCGVMKTYDAQVFQLCESSFLIVEQFLRIKNSVHKPYELNSNQNRTLTSFMFNVSKNYESNDDVNTIKLLEIYIGLIQDELIDISHLITLLQFIQTDIFEQALKPVFNTFCTREKGNKLCNVIDIFLVYMFENITSESENFEDIKFKDVIEIASIIARLINQCNDEIGKRLVSTYVHRQGIQYAMDDTLDYPFKQFFWVLCSMCNSLSSYDAEQLANYLIGNPKIKELINIGNVHILTYLFRLQERYNANQNVNSDSTE